MFKSSIVTLVLSFHILSAGVLVHAAPASPVPVPEADLANLYAAPLVSVVKAHEDVGRVVNSRAGEEPVLNDTADTSRVLRTVVTVTGQEPRSRAVAKQGTSVPSQHGVMVVVMGGGGLGSKLGNLLRTVLGDATDSAAVRAPGLGQRQVDPGVVIPVPPEVSSICSDRVFDYSLAKIGLLVNSLADSLGGIEGGLLGNIPENTDEDKREEGNRVVQFRPERGGLLRTAQGETTDSAAVGEPEVGQSLDDPRVTILPGGIVLNCGDRVFSNTTAEVGILIHDLTYSLGGINGGLLGDIEGDADEDERE